MLIIHYSVKPTYLCTMNVLLHPMRFSGRLPVKFNNPFCYEPDALCLSAAKEVRRYVEANHELHADAARGKMFGVLIVQDEERHLGYLAAYSGLLAGRNLSEFFVPPVFDATLPDGYFKTHEAEITAINREIDGLACSERYHVAVQKAEDCAATCTKREADYRQMMREAKAKRDAMRASSGGLTATEEAQLVLESQHQKAELRRLRQRNTEETAEACSEKTLIEQEIKELKERRRTLSDALQTWLFNQYAMLNARGERRGLHAIFAQTPQRVPPSGAGDCCAPKLLQYAYLNNMHPISMAEFWYGASPRAEVRLDGTFYPACRGKCLPILTFMLQGLSVEAERHEHAVSQPLEVVFEDEWLTVVNKPAGMKSVRGRQEGNSVQEIMERKAKGGRQPMLVHRLDMDTSGLIVVANGMELYKKLQRQFAQREVKKRYIALLDGTPTLPKSGRISLPLCADPLDRPYQKVDYERGKEAVTDYRIISQENGVTRIELRPQTGRTHQLRVHCAHADGLGTPILGDKLYGRRLERMYLHAESITFRHPITGETMVFERKIAPSPTLPRGGKRVM